MFSNSEYYFFSAPRDHKSFRVCMGCLYKMNEVNIFKECCICPSVIMFGL